MKIITIGRHDSNEIVINDEKASRNHCQIIQDDNNNFTLADLNSTNGTFVNGQRITGEVRLEPNDSIRVGNTIVAWQEFFMQATQGTSPVSTPVPRVKNPRKTGFIAAAVIAVLLLADGTTVYFMHKNKQEKIEAESKAKQQAEEKVRNQQEQERLKVIQDAIDADKVAADKRIAAEEATRKAAQSKSAEDKKKAEIAVAAQKTAENNAKKKNEEADKAKAAQKAAEEKAKAAEEKAKAADSAKKEAEAKATSANSAKEEAENKLKKAQIELEALKKEREKLINKEFNTLLSSKDFSLLVPSTNTSDNVKEQWIKIFNDVKIVEEKREIINKLRKAIDDKKEQKISENKPKEETEKQDTTIKK